MTRTTISQADLAERTQEVVDRVHLGEVAIVEISGQAQVVLLDALDYRLLLALVHCAIEERERGQEADDPNVKVLQAYLGHEINLGKAAELLDLSRFELQQRFLRLGVPLRLGPATLEDAWKEIRMARSLAQRE
jgi:predicted HTH domain antitoxin